MTDRSETGCRLLAPAKDAPARLGELLAIQEGDDLDARRRAPDAAPAGRRGHRRREVIAKRLVRVLMRTWATPTDDGARQRRPAVLRHLPACARREPAVGAAQPDRPDDQFATGGMVELDTGNARYLIRFTQTLERQAGWSWALFNAVRKLSPEVLIGRGSSRARRRRDASGLQPASGAIRGVDLPTGPGGGCTWSVVRS